MQPKLYPRLTLALLTGLNILNYIDRSVLWAVQPLVKEEFKVTDAQIGLLTTTFFWFYMCAAPFIGYLGDRYSRKRIISVGIIIWSGFTFLTAITHSFNGLMWRHILVGIGEASYASIAPTLVADLFPLERRGRMLAIFSAGLPFGTAVGYLLGGAMGQHFHDWRPPFLVAGIPGFLLAMGLWFLPEPPRGRTDIVDVSAVGATLPGLFRNRAFMSATLGLAMYTFAMGGLQAWIPTFLTRVRDMTLQSATTIFGGITVFNGIVATLIGGWIGDRLIKKYAGAYYTFSGWAMLVSVPLLISAIYLTGQVMFPAMFVAEFFLLINTGPVNAALVNSVGPNIRATAMAVNIFVIHLLGDASSPYVIGKISDLTSLQTGFWATFVAAALSGIILVYGARFAPRLAAPQPD
ncbi:MAG TPA: MFS transporter [Candidatus Angelobacter sp.]|nr:MFS transporter [Candidatus Angelobacter sp.]